MMTTVSCPLPVLLLSAATVGENLHEGKVSLQVIMEGTLK